MHQFFFLGLEKKRQAKNYITEVENEKGEKNSDYVEILEVVEGFYANLLKKSGVGNS